ncbi:MAG TPA: YceH family protein [Thermoleophilaceae bacterium]
MDPDPVEIRVLGCLVEKQRTTPDAYPLTLNSLRLACNQSTNRDPVVDYGDSEIRAALERLGRRGWTRMASWGGRSVKYRQLLGDALGLSREQVALLAVLMLRGPQTPGELKGRSERLHTFGSLAEVEQELGALGERELVRALPRRPGQKEQRYEQLLGGEEEGDPGSPAPVAAAAPVPRADVGPAAADRAAPPNDLEERVARLEREVAALRAELGAS